LIVGQNPGEITDEAFEKVGKPDFSWDWRTLYDWYAKGVLNSQLGSTFNKMINPDWHHTYLFTNAVLCRTPGNRAPSPEMQITCSIWTKQLAHQRKGVVLMGKVAQKQYLGEEVAARVRDGELSKFRGQFVLPIYHYASHVFDLTKYSIAFKKLVAKISDS
jgi:uracil-DNA glycosylase